MLLKKHKLHSAKRWMICLLLLMLVLSPAHAEMMTETPTTDEEIAQTTSPAQISYGPTTEPTEAETAVIQEEGTQLVTGPVLMVTDYAVIEGDTVPGSSFILEMTIANLSEYASAHNVLATLTIENVSVSLQEGATNQKYYHEIPPLQTVSAQYPLEVYSYCTEENMILSMTTTCYDTAAVHYNFQTMMTPNVEVARTLHVGSLTVPQFVHRNSSMIISATLTNMEPVTLNNVMMHVVTQYNEQVTEIGQLLTGESKTTNCIYRFPEQKTEAVQVYFSYESLYGHKYTTDPQAFEVVVYDPTEQSNFASSGSFSVMDVMENLLTGIVIPGINITLPIPVLVLIVLGCVGYAVILYFVLRQRRR